MSSRRHASSDRGSYLFALFHHQRREDDRRARRRLHSHSARRSSPRAAADASGARSGRAERQAARHYHRGTSSWRSLATLVVNKLRGDSRSRLRQVRPASASRRKAMLEDIAILTGGQMIAEDLGIKLENVTLAMLGKAKRIRIEKENTTVINGAGKEPTSRRASARSRRRSRKPLRTTTKRSSRSVSPSSRAASR